jgi:lipoic acid synthetase
VFAVLLSLQGNRQLVQQVATSGLDVFAHNVETVERLQPVVRDRRANWKQSLGVLAAAKDAGASITKTSIMLGCGEHKEEVGGGPEGWARQGYRCTNSFVIECLGLLQTAC